MYHNRNKSNPLLGKNLQVATVSLVAIFGIKALYYLFLKPYSDGTSETLSGDKIERNAMIRMIEELLVDNSAKGLLYQGIFSFVGSIGLVSIFNYTTSLLKQQSYTSQRKNSNEFFKDNTSSKALIIQNDSLQQNLDRLDTQLASFRKKLHLYNKMASKSSGEHANDIDVLIVKNPELLDEIQKYNSNFICPITREIMRDPVKAPDGYYFERFAIQAWYKSGARKCILNENLALTDPYSWPTQRVLQQEIKEKLQAMIAEKESSSKMKCALM